MTKKKDGLTLSAPKKGKFTRLTPRQWAEAEGLYSSGQATQTQIAQRYGVSEQAVFKHMKQRNVRPDPSKAQAHRDKVAEAVAQSVVDDAAIVVARAKETREVHYKMAEGIAKLTWGEILKAKQDNVPVSVANANLKALDAAITVLTKARMERYAVLGLDREDVDSDEGLPELVIAELTADQIDELRNRDESDFEELPDEDVADATLEDEDDAVVEE